MGALAEDPRIAWLIATQGSVWHGVIQCGDRAIELQDRLTLREAGLLNQHRYGGYYQGGSYAPYFFDRSVMVHLAIAKYKGWFSQAQCLVDGDPLFVKPHYILDLDAPKAAIVRLNYLAQISETVDGDAVASLADEWKRLLLGILK